MKFYLAVTYTFLLLFTTDLLAQNNDVLKPTWTETLEYNYVNSITDQIKDGTFIPSDKDDYKKLGKEKRWDGNKVVPGKGLPNGDDPLLYLQENVITKSSRDPILTFETTSNTATPSDPTGEIGRDYYFASWNSSFRFFNLDGSYASPASNLSTIFGSNVGDPIALYDSQVDRYIITCMGNSGLNFAISETNNPIMDGWHVYSASSFGTDGQLPDYPKYSIWSDGYYCTTNTSGNDLYVLEREKIINGDPTASIQGFNTPQMQSAGFSSAQILDITNDNHPQAGNATLIYMQDDAWAGVSNDHLKIWTVNIDWDNSNNSSISSPYELPTSSFTGVFDGGSFANLTQSSGPDIDAMQACIMNQAQFRKFPTYNSATFNFVVNTTGSSSNELAGIRWYELRQDADGEPWTIFQEGTYTAPDGRHAFGASMAMDSQGNIGMGYSSMNATSPISLRYTGRFVNDPVGQMSIEENLFATSTATNPNTRYADYSHMSVDPSNDKTFWFVSEYFNPGRRDLVGTFQIAADFANDIGIVDINSPISGSLTNAENITISIFNYGEDTVSNFDVSYQLDSGNVITETFTGSLASNETGEFTFSTTADLSSTGAVYEICAYSSLTGDEDSSNDSFCAEVQSLDLNDLGVSNIISPVSAANGSSNELVTIEITNYGGGDQSNFDVSYEFSGVTVTETVSGPISANSTFEYIFTETIDLSFSGDYEITATTLLENDSDSSNNSFTVNISVNCPEEYSLPIIWKDDFECYDPFTIADFGDWIIYDFDGSGTYGANAVDFNNESYEGSAIIYNDVLATPVDGADASGFNNYQGDQGLYFFAATSLLNDDWMISPEFTINGVSSPVLSFWAKSITDQYGLERFQIAVGSTTNPDDFTLISAGNYEEAPTDWTQYEYDLSSYDGQTIRIGIHYVGADSFVLQMDEFKVEGTLGVDDYFLDDSEFKIISLDNNQFNISLATTYNDNISFSVYNISGQTLVYNNISKASDKYIYDLDMSYASAGIYLVKMGNSSIGYRIGKIIVK